MDSTEGTAAEDLVYLGWFTGAWRCTIEVKQAITGPKGEAGLNAAPPALKAALAANAGIVGKPEAVNQALVRWLPTSPEKNGLSPGYAVEEDGGAGIGIVAVAQALAGPAATLKIAPGRDGDAVYEVSDGSNVWKVSAAGALGQPENDEDGFRVSEIFEFEDAKAAEPKVLGLVRIVTTYQRPPSEKLKIVRAVQRTSVLPPPVNKGEPGTEDLVTLSSIIALLPPSSA